jgi:aspartate ammonia-lyase
MVDIEKREHLVDLVEQHHNTGNRVWDHEVRIRILERDYAEIKEIREDVKSIQLELTAVKTTMQSLPEFIGKTINAEISSHERFETENQNKIMRYIIGLILAVLGAVLYLASEKALDFFLK